MVSKIEGPGPRESDRARGVCESFTSLGLLLFRGCKEIAGCVPVDRVPPSLDVVGTEILILQIVGMFPDVQSDHGLSGKKICGVLIRRGIDGQLAFSYQQPGPAGAKAPQPGGRKFRLKFRERSKRRVDRSSQVPLRFTAAAFLHQRPEEGMIPMAPAVVTHGRPDVVGDGIKTLQKLID